MKYYINVATIQEAVFLKIGEFIPPWKTSPSTLHFKCSINYTKGINN